MQLVCASIKLCFLLRRRRNTHFVNAFCLWFHSNWYLALLPPNHHCAKRQYHIHHIIECLIKRLAANMKYACAYCWFRSERNVCVHRAHAHTFDSVISIRYESIQGEQHSFSIARDRSHLKCNSNIAAFLGLKCCINWTFCENIEARNIDESFTIPNEWMNEQMFESICCLFCRCMPLLLWFI